MKTQDIKNMARAWQEVQEAAMDPVNKKALKKDFDDREDKDIDNDGDTDKSDEYLHNRRKAVSKAAGKDSDEVVVNPKMKDNKKSSNNVDMGEQKESVLPPVYSRILEKADQTKGATEAEAMDSKASKGEKDFVDQHGGLDGNPCMIDGPKAAEMTAKSIADSGKAAPKRPADNAAGDKTMPKAK